MSRENVKPDPPHDDAASTALIEIAKRSAVFAIDAVLPGTRVVVDLARQVHAAVSSEGRMNRAVADVAFDLKAADAVDRQLLRTVEGARGAIIASAEKWEAKPTDERPTESNIAALLADLRKAIASEGDHRKLDLLKNVFAHAFEPEVYEIGITQELLALFSKVSFADLRTLREHNMRSGSDAQVRKTGSLQEYSFEKLTSLGLLRIATGRPPERAADWELTELGRRFVAMLAPATSM